MIEGVEYEEYFKLFNTLKGVVAALICPILGLISDLSLKLFKTCSSN